MANQTNQDNESEFPAILIIRQKEDIMNLKNNERVDIDVENLSRSKSVPPATLGPLDKSVLPSEITSDETLSEDIEDDVAGKAMDESDITKDDLIALGDEGANFSTVDKLSDGELDVPGAEDDDANEEIGEEDEENNYYSLGGDAHENLEEDKGG